MLYVTYSFACYFTLVSPDSAQIAVRLISGRESGLSGAVYRITVTYARQYLYGTLLFTLPESGPDRPTGP